MHVTETDVQENPALAGQTAERIPLTRVRPRAVRWSPALRALGFWLGLVALVHALAALATTLAPDFNTRFLQLDQAHMAAILADAERIDALALGNSHAGSLHLGALGYANGYRFPRADGDLFETRALVRYLAPRLPNVEVVLIPVSYFSFLEENTAAAEVAVRREHLYAALPAWRFAPGDLEPFLLGKSHVYLPVARLVRADNWEGVFSALLGRGAEPEG
ncbi:MAG TPA: hypothetical protein VFF68_06755, partial [Anaerolineaceae bacterium]|nr:hypothetical protein [Anaerolineaceae bacterium]